MSLKEVKEEILGKAESEASSVIREGEKEVDNILLESKKQIDEKRKNTEMEIKNLLENIEKKEIASAQFEVKKKIFQKKKELMDKVFEVAEKRLISLSDKEKKSYLKKLLDKAKKEINVRRVYTKKGNNKFFQGVQVKESDMKDGLIAETGDKSVRTDYRFETLLEDIKEKNLPEVAKILFG